MTAPPHRGAARQMYGSGSLRPPGTKPIYATGQRQHGIRTTVSPDQMNQRRIFVPQAYPIVPYSIPMREYERYPSGYPIFYHRDMSRLPSNARHMERPSNRGMYGGRLEYPDGRPNRGLGIVRTRYPFDFGFIPGKGFDRMPPDYESRRMGRLPSKSGMLERGGSDMHLKFPEEEEEKPIQEHRGHPCGGDCEPGQYLCIKSCTCIEEKYR